MRNGPIWLMAPVFTLMLSLGAAHATLKEDATQAALQIREATGRLEEAMNKDDQVTALTDLIEGYEAGLSSLRAALRQAGNREQEIRTRWESQRAELSDILGVMIAMQKSPETLLLLHPAGPEATAQTGMILSSILPGLNDKAKKIRQDLDEIAKMREIQESAANTLAGGLGRVQEARRLLAGATRDRSTMPRRYDKDPAELQVLKKSATTLDAFAEGIADMEADVGSPFTDFEGAQGFLPLPVQGKVLRKYNEADAAGIKRPGLVISTAPASLVTTPWLATIRYRGPLLDYGNVVILEPAKDYLLILAGMAQVFGEVGDVLAAGEPVGFMGGKEPSAQEFGIDFVVNAATGRSADLTETLYLELRRDKDTLDPADWFVLNHIVENTGAQAKGQAENQ